MNDFIGKPIELNQLWETLLKWLQHAERSKDPAEQRPPVLHEALLPDTIDGIDLAQGLDRVAGKQAVYLEMLKKFQAGNRRTAEQLTLALAAGNRDEATLLVHTVKGSAGIIGAGELRDQATLLEAKIKAGCTTEQCEAELGSFITVLGNILTQLESKLPV
jgi:HPt (histidine-containing phosphotransfer) domain-containing protein